MSGAEASDAGTGPRDVVRFSPAAASDAGAIRALVRASFAQYVERIGREPAPMLLDWEAILGGEAPRAEVTLAVRGDALTGVLYLELEADHILVDTVAVDAAERGTGLGRRLLELAEERARELGLPEVRLYTNQAMTENVAYYPRRGYVETDRRGDGGYRRVFFAKRV
ncbi:GNAT family N-acetyltransferase [Galactobacter valiniphilus]|uniref:GNAT family N-acetyltransferase n=1 Tax=Galactobacter valiniphilus TaxID=2676122 RepID=UPI001F404965|nr:GNAT family N-acetyltransferase [Galactobacter valiniphilus]